MATNDRMRVSDADRERVTARLREHFAEGRLTREELDERVTAALNAKTVGDLRPLMADLPGDSPVTPPVLVRGPVMGRRGPRILPLALLLLLVAVLIPGGGFVVLAFFQVVLVLMLAAGLTALFAAHRFRRRMRRHWQTGQFQPVSQDWMGHHHFRGHYRFDPRDWPAGG
jgi:Domain of unknown function (DUF1707)